jgi:hypothetical protein
MPPNTETDAYVDSRPELDEEEPSRLRRGLGPSCFLSLVLLLLLLVAVRRFAQLPFPVIGFLALALWMVVLAVLLRLYKPLPLDERYEE